MSFPTQTRPVETQLVPVFVGQIGGVTTRVCDGRTLHAFLENGDKFAGWIIARINKYGFVADQDFALVSENPEIKGRGGDRRSRSYLLSLDMAKELSMVENNAKGREARRYFINMERRSMGMAEPAQLTADCGAPPVARTLADATPDAFLPTLLAQPVAAMGGTAPQTVRWLLEIALGYARNDAWTAARIAATLAGIGLMVRAPDLLVANWHPGLAAVLADTPWATGWHATVHLLPGACRQPSTPYFGGYRSRCQAVPLALVRPLLGDRPTAAAPLPNPPRDPLANPAVRHAINRKAHDLSLDAFERNREILEAWVQQCGDIADPAAAIGRIGALELDDGQYLVVERQLLKEFADAVNGVCSGYV